MNRIDRTLRELHKEALQYKENDKNQPINYTDENVRVKTRNGQRIIYIEPYSRDMDLDFVLRKVRKIHENEPSDTQLVLPDEFVIDGLSQTNVDLIKKGSVLENTYTGEYREI